jgi:hypothetical protein
MRPDGEWVRIDPEVEAAAAAVETFAAAETDAVVVSQGRHAPTDGFVAVLPPAAGSGCFSIPAAARAVLEPGVTSATGWTRATVLRHAAAQGLVVSGMQPDGEWVRLNPGAGGM